MDEGSPVLCNALCRARGCCYPRKNRPVRWEHMHADGISQVLFDKCPNINLKLGVHAGERKEGRQRKEEPICLFL